MASVSETVVSTSKVFFDAFLDKYLVVATDTWRIFASPHSFAEAIENNSGTLKRAVLYTAEVFALFSLLVAMDAATDNFLFAVPAELIVPPLVLCWLIYSGFYCVYLWVIFGKPAPFNVVASAVIYSSTMLILSLGLLGTYEFLRTNATSVLGELVAVLFVLGGAYALYIYAVGSVLWIARILDKPVIKVLLAYLAIWVAVNGSLLYYSNHQVR